MTSPVLNSSSRLDDSFTFFTLGSNMKDAASYRLSSRIYTWWGQVVQESDWISKRWVRYNKQGCRGPKPGLPLTFYSGLFPLFFSSDAILNMVNNIAVNVLGGGPEMQGMSSTKCWPVFSVARCFNRRFCSHMHTVNGLVLFILQATFHHRK